MSAYADLLTLVFYAAVIYLLVKPGSTGADAVKTITDSVAGLITAATSTT